MSPEQQYAQEEAIRGSANELYAAMLLMRAGLRVIQELPRDDWVARKRLAQHLINIADRVIGVSEGEG